MKLPDLPGALPVIGSPPLGYRFMVSFLVGGAAPNPVDIAFQKVSGIEITIDTRTVNEGGQNLYSHTLPTKVQHGNLVLERGLVVGSPLALEFNVTLSTFGFSPSNVLIMLMGNEGALPVASWLFVKAYPVKWTIDDFNAEENKVVIERMELAYQRMQTLRL